MTAYNVGSATTVLFQTTAVLPTDTTGAHTFTVFLDSVLQVAGMEAFRGLGASTWTALINGTITGTATDLPDFGLVLGAGTATVSHKITVGTEGSIFANAFGIASSNAADIINNGVIDASLLPGTGVTTAVAVRFDPGILASRTINITNNATAVISGDNAAITNASTATMVVTNLGSIEGGVAMTAVHSTTAGAVITGGTLRLTSGIDGYIDGGIRSGWVGSSVVNNGEIWGAIDGDIDGTFVASNGAIDLNRDSIFAGTETVAGGVNAQLGISVTNTGLISGGQNILADSITGSGVAGNQVALDGSDGRDSLSNSSTGIIWGDLSMSAGNDTINNAGMIVGSVDLGGIDTLAGDLYDTVTGIDGNDSLSNALTGRIFGSVFAGAGNDTITNLGDITGSIDLGSGNDRLIHTGTSFGEVVLGAGDDFASIGGSLGIGQADLTAGIGNDTVNVGATGLLDDIRMGNGNDVVTIAGSVDGVWLDKFTETGDTVVSATIDGDDRLTVLATGKVLGSLYFGEGNNVLSNAGLIDSDPLSVTTVPGGVRGENIFFGAGNDSLSNATTGRIDATEINMGAGDDTVVNAGSMIIENEVLDAYIQLGAGNDRLTNTGAIGQQVGNGLVMFYETLGNSRNMYHTLQYNDFDFAETTGTGPELRIAVDGGDGNDVITTTTRIFGSVELGAGNDSFLGGAFNDFAYDGQGNDTMNMGAGADFIYVRGQVNYAGGDTFAGGDGIDLIQFGSDSVNSGGVHIDLTAGRINYELGADSLNAQDSIIGFEQVLGTNLADSILGGVGAETLDGGAGADTIAGRGGKDVLIGDNGADRFVFTATGDSGKTRATRDVIVDFASAEGDKIHLLFDGNGTLTGGVTNGFDSDLLENVDFSGDTGQLRTILQGGNTIVELDMNGDKRADFQIELVGIVDLSMSDFIFS